MNVWIRMINNNTVSSTSGRIRTSAYARIDHIPSQWNLISTFQCIQCRQ